MMKWEILGLLEFPVLGVFKHLGVLCREFYHPLPFKTDLSKFLSSLFTDIRHIINDVQGMTGFQQRMKFLMNTVVVQLNIF